MYNDGKGSITVKTQPLDSLLSKFQKIKLVKTDVESAELMILQHSRLLYKVDRFIIEVHSKENMDNLITLFKNNGFKTKVIVGSRHFLVADANE